MQKEDILSQITGGEEVKLPECTGYKSWTDCGYEFDCEAVHGQSCEDCLCTYKSLGGLWNPETGKRVNPIIAFIFYGAKNTEQQAQAPLEDEWTQN